MLSAGEGGRGQRDGSHALFDKIPSRKKRLVFWEGYHDDWPRAFVLQSLTL